MMRWLCVIFGPRWEWRWQAHDHFYKVRCGRCGARPGKGRWG